MAREYHGTSQLPSLDNSANYQKVTCVIATGAPERPRESPAVSYPEMISQNNHEYEQAHPLGGSLGRLIGASLGKNVD